MREENAINKKICSFSDTSSTTRIIPLVHPSNLQITSRGRVVFNILPSGRMGSLNNVTSYISYLPPEYLINLGKKITFIESDMEKVSASNCLFFWIVFLLVRWAEAGTYSVLAYAVSRNDIYLPNAYASASGQFIFDFSESKINKRNAKKFVFTNMLISPIIIPIFQHLTHCMTTAINKSLNILYVPHITNCSCRCGFIHWVLHWDELYTHSQPEPTNKQKHQQELQNRQQHRSRKIIQHLNMLFEPCAHQILPIERA